MSELTKSIKVSDEMHQELEVLKYITNCESYNHLLEYMLPDMIRKAMRKCLANTEVFLGFVKNHPAFELELSIDQDAWNPPEEVIKLFKEAYTNKGPLKEYPSLYETYSKYGATE